MWDVVATEVGRRLEAIAKDMHLSAAKVEWRAKDTGSLIGKAIRKERTDIRSFGDLAGARILVPFASLVEPLIDAIQSDEQLVVTDVDRKQLRPDKLAYRGIHLDLHLAVSPASLPQAGLSLGLEDLRCEVQVKTFAQSLWSELSHLVTYKQDVSDDADRRVKRLLALCEIIDDEIEGAMKLVMSERDVVGQTVDSLEQAYYSLTGRSYDRESTVALVDTLFGGIPMDEREGYSAHILEFASEYRDRLALLLADRPEARGIPLLTRPEAILIFERLTNGPIAFHDYWVDQFGDLDIGRLEDAWGVTP